MRLSGVCLLLLRPGWHQGPFFCRPEETLLGTRLRGRHVGQWWDLSPSLSELTVPSKENKAILMNTKVGNRGFWVKTGIIYCLLCARHHAKCFSSVSGASLELCSDVAGEMRIHTHEYLQQPSSLSVNNRLPWPAQAICLGCDPVALCVSSPAFTVFLWENLCCVLSSYCSSRLLENSSWCTTWGLVCDF